MIAKASDDETGDRVEPGPAEHGVGEQADERWWSREALSH